MGSFKVVRYLTELNISCSYFYIKGLDSSSNFFHLCKAEPYGCEALVMKQAH